MTKSDVLTPRQVRFVAALWTSPSIEAAAKATNVSVRTARRWLKLPPVLEALRKEQAETLAAVTRQAVGAMPGALQTLVEIHEDAATPPGARVSAARAVLESSLRFAETVDLEARVTALEVQQDGN